MAELAAKRAGGEGREAGTEVSNATALGMLEAEGLIDRG